MGLKKQVTVLRVDPDRRTIAPMRILVGKDAIPTIKKLCRAKRVGWHELLEVDDVKLTSAGGLDVPEEHRMWRIRGGEDNAGISILFGQAGAGMTDCPVKKDWLEKRIQWLEGEDVAGRDARADEVIAIMDEDLRAVMRTAAPTPSGAMWLAIDKREHLPALINLQLTGEKEGGQRLTPLGIAVHDKLTAEAPADA